MTGEWFESTYRTPNQLLLFERRGPDLSGSKAQHGLACTLPLLSWRCRWLWRCPLAAGAREDSGPNASPSRRGRGRRRRSGIVQAHGAPSYGAHSRPPARVCPPPTSRELPHVHHERGDVVHRAAHGGEVAEGGGGGDCVRRAQDDLGIAARTAVGSQVARSGPCRGCSGWGEGQARGWLARRTTHPGQGRGRRGGGDSRRGGEVEGGGGGGGGGGV